MLVRSLGLGGFGFRARGFEVKESSIRPLRPKASTVEGLGLRVDGCGACGV